MEINSKQKVWIIVLAMVTAVIIICVSVLTAISCPTRDDGIITVHLEEQPPFTTLTEKGELVGQAGVQYTETIVPDYIELTEDDELRAVWIGYMSERNITATKIDQMVDDCAAAGANAVIFHVRAFGDALYESAYFPWSHVVAGTQGVAPADGFDPLAYIIERCHARGMQLHAWVNPLRIQLAGGKVPENLSADNPYIIYTTDADAYNDCYVIDYNEGKFYNPGEEAVRKLIVDGVAEIAANYNVDGIHWDDYFYPADDESFDDSASYQRYLDGGGTATLIEWRTDNINSLVRDTYNRVKATNSNCIFGISPAGNIQNCLNMGADVYQWCASTGYIDYICPQIYWTFDSTAAPFAERCLAWRQMVVAPDIKFYVGLALYKAGSEVDDGKWLLSDRIIADQIEFIRGEDVDADGFMLFSYDYLSAEQTTAEMSHIIELLE